jgi:hypothetical protein
MRWKRDCIYTASWSILKHSFEPLRVCLVMGRESQPLSLCLTKKKISLRGALVEAEGLRCCVHNVHLRRVLVEGPRCCVPGVVFDLLSLLMQAKQSQQSFILHSNELELELEPKEGGTEEGSFLFCCSMAVTLPADVLSTLFLYLRSFKGQRARSHSPDRSTLFQCALVCKQWMSPALSTLYCNNSSPPSFTLNGLFLIITNR